MRTRRQEMQELSSSQAQKRGIAGGFYNSSGDRKIPIASWLGAPRETQACLSVPERWRLATPQRVLSWRRETRGISQPKRGAHQAGVLPLLFCFGKQEGRRQKDVVSSEPKGIKRSEDVVRGGGFLTCPGERGWLLAVRVAGPIRKTVDAKFDDPASGECSTSRTGEEKIVDFGKRRRRKKKGPKKQIDRQVGSCFLYLSG